MQLFNYREILIFQNVTWDINFKTNINFIFKQTFKNIYSFTGIFKRKQFKSFPVKRLIVSNLQ